jgi:hypothetical protein
MERYGVAAGLRAQRASALSGPPRSAGLCYRGSTVAGRVPSAPHHGAGPATRPAHSPWLHGGQPPTRPEGTNSSQPRRVCLAAWYRADGGVDAASSDVQTLPTPGARCSRMGRRAVVAQVWPARFKTPRRGASMETRMGRRAVVVYMQV